MSQLTPTQKQAVEHISGSLLIVAGAGTGKTTVLTEKIAYLIDKGLAKPEEILALTFTDKAAAELRERVDAKMELGYVDLAIFTFHKFCERLLQEYGLEIGLPRQFKLLSTIDSWLLLRDHVYDLGLDYFRPVGNPNKHLDELLTHFSKCKDELVEPADYLQVAENTVVDADNPDAKTRLTELANAYHAYNQLVLKAGALDFGDVVMYAVKLLRDKAHARNGVAKRFKYILVDEFQDVNWAQYVLVKLLAEKAQLTVVGDDDQSIYAFRGASVSNILRFKDDYPTATSLVLTENFRSRQEILDVAYKVIQNNNPDRLETKLQIKKELTAARDWPVAQMPVVQYEELLDGASEAKRVAELILEIKEKNPEATWDDFAILVRANNHAEEFMSALARAGVPYEFLTASGLYREPIVLDLLSFLRLTAQQYDNVAWFRLWRLPMLGLSEADIHVLTDYAHKKKVDYIQLMRGVSTLHNVSDAGRTIITNLLGWLEQAWNTAKTEVPTRIMVKFLEDSGYLQYLTHEIETNNSSQATRQIFQLKKFLESCAEFEKTVADPHVAHLVTYFDAIQEAGDAGALYQPEETPESVNIMTVHRSKGLEFKYVFVVNVAEGRFPSARRGEGLTLPAELIHEVLPSGDYHFQEERRLFYVAMTRAKERLILTSAKNYGGKLEKKVSRFLVEANLAAAPLKGKRVSVTETISNFGIEKTASAEFNYPLPTTYSFSQMRSYETCPYQYKLGTILHIPAPTTHHLSYGNTIHNTLHQFYVQVQQLNQAQQDSLFDLPVQTKPTGVVKVPSLQTLLELYEACWQPDGYPSKQEKNKYFAKGKEELTTFYETNDGQWTVPTALEKGFKIKVGDYIISGRIDRVDSLLDNSLHIIDYKTGKPKEKLAKEDKEQLLLYHLVAQKLPEYRNLGPVGKLSFYYLTNNQSVDFVADPEDLQEWHSKMITIIDGIQARDFTPKPDKITCSYCPFKTICEWSLA